MDRERLKKNIERVFRLKGRNEGIEDCLHDYVIYTMQKGKKSLFYFVVNWLKRDQKLIEYNPKKDKRTYNHGGYSYENDIFLSYCLYLDFKKEKIDSIINEKGISPFLTVEGIAEMEHIH